MIPARIEDDEASSRERRVFGLLAEDDPETNDWALLHSLDRARRETGRASFFSRAAASPGPRAQGDWTVWRD